MAWKIKRYLFFLNILLCNIFVLEGETDFIWIVALLFVIRPTSAIVWIPLCLFHLILNKQVLWDLIIEQYLIAG